MPISGLVITFDRAVAECSSATEQLNDHGSIELGEAKGHKLAVVVETFSKKEDKNIWEWVQNLPFVANVSVAFVGLDDDDSRNNPAGPPPTEH